MKKSTRRRQKDIDRDTLRSRYDFARAARGATVARYREGSNVVVIDPDVLEVFPDADSVNGVLRALAAVVRRQRRSRPRRRSS